MNIIIEALIRNAAQAPKSIAFIGEHKALNNHDLLMRVRHAAEQLTQWAPRCIALRAENSLDWVIADLAALYAKIPIVPVPHFFASQQIEHVLSESGADLLVGEWQQPTSNLVGQIETLGVYHYAVDNKASLLPQTWKITFTSGSTGTPKGVCLSHKQLANVSDVLAKTIEAEADCQKHLVLLPLSTLLENITGIYVPILLGASSVVVRGQSVGLIGSSHLNLQQFASVLADYQPNSLVLTPALLLALIEVVKEMPLVAQTLEFVAVGGARVSPQLMQLAHSLAIPAYEGYGLSEHASVVALNKPSEFKAGTSGKPLPHTKVNISDDGEILLSGCVALGYLNQPFRSSWFATGDLGHLDADGFLVIDGRKKNLIITTYGRNISPEWIESEAQAFPALHGMVIIGDGQDSLTAIIEQKEIEQTAVAIKQLNSLLPDYAQVRTLVTVPNLPSYLDFFTSNGRPIRAKFEYWLTSSNVLNIPHSVTSILD